MHLIFNELSIGRPASDRHEACEWMTDFASLLKHIDLYQTHNADTIDDFYKLDLGLIVPDHFWETSISDGFRIADWLCNLSEERELKQHLMRRLDRAPFLEDKLETSANMTDSIEGMGIRLAYESRKPTVSVPSPAGSHLRLNVKQDTTILNLFSIQTWTSNLVEIGMCYCLKPIYSNPGHHDRSNPASFRGGGSMTSTLPEDAEEVYSDAVPADHLGNTWWGYSRKRAFYRYKVHISGYAHWNGSTLESDARALTHNQVPSLVKEYFLRKV